MASGAGRRCSKDKATESGLTTREKTIHRRDKAELQEPQ
jgi:hypothetical protein